MDLSRACEYLHLVEAASRGETIQIKYPDDITKQLSGWQDMKSSAFTCDPNLYRIKPKEPSKVYLVWCFNSLTTSKRWVMVAHCICEDHANAYVAHNKVYDPKETRKYCIQEVECREPNDYFIVFNKEKV